MSGPAQSAHGFSRKRAPAACGGFTISIYTWPRKYPGARIFHIEKRYGAPLSVISNLGNRYFIGLLTNLQADTYSLKRLLGGKIGLGPFMREVRLNLAGRPSVKYPIKSTVLGDTVKLTEEPDAPSMCPLYTDRDERTY